MPTDQKSVKPTFYEFPSGKNPAHSHAKTMGRIFFCLKIKGRKLMKKSNKTKTRNYLDKKTWILAFSLKWH